MRGASLYNDIGNKLELLALLGDAVCAEVREPELGADWRAQLEALAANYRRVLLAHRDAGPLRAVGDPIAMAARCGAPNGVPSRRRLCVRST